MNLFPSCSQIPSASVRLLAKLPAQHDLGFWPIERRLSRTTGVFRALSQ